MKVIYKNVGLFKQFYITKTLKFASDYLKQPTDLIEVNVSFVDKTKIAELNSDYRGVNSVTDVLSFPSIDVNKQIIEPNDFINDIDPETDLLNLGDIIICLPRAKEQAKEYGHGVKREVAFLALHSFLHLLGYDHMTDAEEQQMTELQKQILDALNIKR